MTPRQMFPRTSAILDDALADEAARLTGIPKETLVGLRNGSLRVVPAVRGGEPRFDPRFNDGTVHVPPAFRRGRR